MKKILSYLLVFTLLLSLTACGSSTPESSVASVASTPEVTVTPSPTPTPTPSPTPEPTPEPVNVTFSETVSTDVVEFTLNDCKFAEKVGLSSDNWLQPVSRTSGSVPGDGKIYVWFSFTVKNVSKDELNGYDVCKVKVDYNDGFIYDEAVYSGMSNYSTAAHISRNVGLPSIIPLGEQNYWGYVICAADVLNVRTAPLNIIFTLPSSEGSNEFIYPMTLNENLANEDVLNAVRSLNKVKNNLDFIIRNIEKVVGDNFAESFVEEINADVSFIDITTLPESLPSTIAAIPQIQEQVQIIGTYLRPVSSSNVVTVVELCQNTINLIDSLLNDELNEVRYLGE